MLLIIRKIKFVYYDIFWVDKAIGVNEDEKSILESLEKIGRASWRERV